MSDAAWLVEYTEEFAEWWRTLDEGAQIAVARATDTCGSSASNGVGTHYERYVPIVDEIYDRHLAEIGKEDP